MKIISKSETDTYKLANDLANLIKGGDTILLNGDLGAGKTTFVKGFAKAKGVKENVTSPTFTLLKTYQTLDYQIVHVDAYRLDNELFEELDDYIGNDTVIFIEWSEHMINSLFKEYLAINIKYIDETTREYELVANGKRYEKVLEELNYD